jgi:hypothetical protein
LVRNITDVVAPPAPVPTSDSPPRVRLSPSGATRP